MSIIQNFQNLKFERMLHRVVAIIFTAFKHYKQSR